MCTKKERKQAKEAKQYTQALREVKYAYTKKNDFSLEANSIILKMKKTEPIFL